MQHLLCTIIGHNPTYHLGYIWSGTIMRDHGICKRCGITTRFERPTEARVAELEALGDLRDCTNSGCKCYEN